MSRSKHQRHGHKRKSRHGSFDIMGYKPEYDPTKPMSDFRMISQGKSEYIWRKRKTKPFGRKNFIGYGEENYSAKYNCEFFQPEVDKKSYRQELKRELNKELENYDYRNEV